MSGPALSDLRVLVVDDNDHMRRLLRTILESLGIRQVRDVENGMVALNDSRLNVPDVIITDMMMSPIDGLEFSRMLRDDPTHPATHVPVMMVTGYSEKQHVEAARDAGVSEFLAKPVTANGVAARLRSVVENPRRFIRTSDFAGPDRRRRQVPVPEEDKRRAEDLSHSLPAVEAHPGPVREAPVRERRPATTYDPDGPRPPKRQVLR
ncbi:MAG: response regulator [Alphaproteobacteria bacterium]|nr:response regulator [Alphaproteobacteria bacterium]